ncbi:hypothetical protein GE09DRAFT_457409 [Coniochaeta sp. 2T2.1]|nr:hypothetical protein GE09DRAFT_457409 [Coniochaeta sp. 2T2.1]
MTRLVTVHPSQKLFFELVWDDDLGGGTSYSRYFAVVPDSAEAAGLITQPEFDDGKSVFAEQTGSKTGGGGLNGGDDNPSGGTTTTLTPVPTFTDDSTPIGLPSTTTSVGADPGLGGSAAEPGTSSRSSSKLSTGAIAGIAVAAALVGLGLLAALIFCLIRRRRRNNLDQSAISPGGYGNHTPELIAQKEANASVGVEVSPHSPYSDDGGAAHAVGAGGMLQHSSTRQEEMPLAGYRERDMHGSVGSREVAGLADGESLRGSQTGVGRETPTAVRHLVEDGMTEDEIRRLEEEERELDQAIEQAGGGRR